MPFSALSLCSTLLHALPTAFKKPTAIQALAIPELLAGNDVLALANTGSGKTLAYGLPLLEALNANPQHQALILVPTRELAMQVSDVINQVGRALDLSAICLCGGVDKAAQQQALADNPNILVATTAPGVRIVVQILNRPKIQLWRANGGHYAEIFRRKKSRHPQETVAAE